MTRRPLLISAVRYGLVGLFNTAVGLGVILALELGLGVQANLANAAGYAVGVCVSFVLSRLFVFGRESPLRSAGPRYLAAIAVAFLLNQAVLTLARRMLPPGDLTATLAQGCGMVSYSGVLFLLCHYWVFAGRRPAVSS